MPERINRRDFSSCRATVVVAEHPAKPLVATDRAIAAADLFAWLDDLVIKTLVVSFGMVMFEVLLDGMAQRLLLKKDHFQKALGFQGAEKSLEMGKQIRAPRGQANRVHSLPFEHGTHDGEAEKLHQVTRIDKRQGETPAEMSISGVSQLAWREAVTVRRSVLTNDGPRSRVMHQGRDLIPYHAQELPAELALVRSRGDCQFARPWFVMEEVNRWTQRM